MIFKTLRELDTNIKAGAHLPVYLLYGEETRQIEKARERLVRTVIGAADSPNLFRLDGSRPLDWDSVGDMLWSVSFVPGRRLVVIDDLALGLLHAEELDKIKTLLTTPLEEAVLLITCRNSLDQFNKKATPGAKLLALADAAGGVCRFAVMTRGDVAKYARSLALKAGCLLDSEESLLLADCCALDSLRVQHEVEKLSAYHAGTGRITKEDIEAMVAPTVDANVFKLGDAVLRRDFTGAMHLIDDLIFLQEEPVSILTILDMCFVDITRAGAARRGNISESTARKELGYGGSYRYTKAAENSRRVGRRALAKILETLADADARIKQAGADQRTVLEVTVLRIMEILREEQN